MRHALALTLLLLSKENSLAEMLSLLALTFHSGYYVSGERKALENGTEHIALTAQPS